MEIECLEIEGLEVQATESRAAAHRDLAEAMLNEIADQAKQALAKRDIKTPVFLVVPASGGAILNFGTHEDPCDGEWERIQRIVSTIVEELLGIPCTQFRELRCKTI